MHFIITTPCRVHCTLIDLNGQLGRIDGGFGVALDRPSMVLESSNGCSGLNLKGPEDLLPVMQEIADRIITKYPDLQQDITLSLVESFPAHVGLGSKTQLALAMVTALLHAQDAPEETQMSYRAQLVERGGTSAIGCNAFERGGFILDGGHTFGSAAEKESFLPSSASRACVGPLLARFNVPKDWRFVLITPNVRPGAHDDEEVSIFQRFCPVPLDEVQAVSHHILMQVLPGIACGDITSFGQGITAIQSYGFKKVEVSLQADVVQQLIPFLVEQGASGAGMSSFGPTIYAVTDTERLAQNLAKAGEEFISEVGGTVSVTSANNSGAILRGNP
jgi:beta-ribofuranosylaminobenzene 5'-phosphate synthase